MALSLTSPITKGKRVIEAQKLLANNPYGKFYRSEIDGEYGPLTAAAVRRAKYWLGYPKKNINGSFGPIIHKFLDGSRKLPAAYAMRRKARLRKYAAQQARKTLGEKALAKAMTQRGVVESPAGSNKVLYSEWYGIRGPWCGMFVDWCYTEVGYKKWGTYRQCPWICYVPSIVAKAKAGEAGIFVTNNPEKGDLVCFDWDGGVADHVGMFIEWIDRSAGTFRSIEGNTAVGNDSNGGEVMVRERHRSNVEAFVRVKP